LDFLRVPVHLTFRFSGGSSLVLVPISEDHGLVSTPEEVLQL
jgi:hypothetical protein